MTLSWPWSNTTYYDDDGLQHILERVMAAARGLKPAPGQPADRDPIHPFGAVQIRYASGDSTIHAQVDKYKRLNIRIPRRADLFGSDLEKMAGLAGVNPQFPSDRIAALSDALLAALFTRHDYSTLRQEYPNKLDSNGGTWGWPAEAARRFSAEHVVPCCEVLIHGRAREGAAHEEKLFTARHTVRRLTTKLEYTRIERATLQTQLERTCAQEAKTDVSLNAAQARLQKLEDKESKKEGH